MRVFLTKAFRRFARREEIADNALVDAIRRAEAGLVDADLGHGLIKQRVARKGGGRSGGYRTIIAYRVGERAVFLFGFAKSERGNVDAATLRNLTDTGTNLLMLSEPQQDELIDVGVLEELAYGPPH